MSSSFLLERLPAKVAGNHNFNNSLLSRRRVYIFPTRQGWAYGAMLLVMLLGAINYNNSMAFVLCFLLASLGIITMLHTYRNLTGIIINSRKPESVFAGQTAFFPLIIDNRFDINRYSVKLHQHKRSRKLFSESKDGAEISVSVDTSSQSRVVIPCKTIKRGTIEPGKIKISTEFPLGIFTAWAYFEPEEECVVYPYPSGHKEMPTIICNDDNASLGMETGTDDFAGFRKYRPGDPVNSIAWKIFAQEKGLLVKQFSGKGSRALIFNWDSVSRLPNIEDRLSQLSYWITLADKSELNYGLDIPGTKINPAFGSRHKHYCLEKLARYGQA